MGGRVSDPEFEPTPDGTPTRRPRPRLSICIPTHHGRCRNLDQLLGELGAQLDGLQYDVEVCVSDNAARDGTEAMVERHRDRLGDRLTYRRNDRDLRFAGNLPLVTAMASGEFCWLFGSDDRPAPGAVRAVLDLIEEHPGASGFQLGMKRMSPDLSEPVELLSAESEPTERETTAFTTPVGIAHAVGVAQLMFSPCVVRSDLWQAVIRDEPGLFERHPDLAQAYIMGRMAQRRPHWVWCPCLLVESRSGQVYVGEELGPRMPRQVQAIARPLERLWADLYGRGSYIYRALLAKWCRWIAHPSTTYAVKIEAEQSWKDDLRWLSTVPLAWWSREFRRSSLPWLLLPHTAFQPGRRWRWALGTGLPLAREARRTTISPTSMPRLTAGYQALVPCSFENHGPEALSSRLPHPVRLAARWFDESGDYVKSGPRTPLLPSVRSGERRTIEVRLEPPFTPGDYLLRISPVQEFVAWFDDLDPSKNCWISPVTVTAPGSGRDR